MKAHSRLTMHLVTLLAAASCMAWSNSSHADAGAEIDTGRALYMQKGCYECHGIFGQGSITTGPALAPHPIPLPAMQAYVHDPKGQMPVFSRKILSDDEISRIHAYLASIPPSPSADSIALLNSGAPSTPEAAMPPEHGASIYAANCAACHGQTGEGGVGPALIGISSRRQKADIEARIREPSGSIMPKLFPNTLSAADVRDVARYVASMKSAE